MFRYWYDIDRDVAAKDELFRRMARLLGRGAESPLAARLSTSPRTNLYDGGNSLVAVMEVPGMTEENINIEAHREVLTVSGERNTEAPEGYRVHRQERTSRSFTRSFGLPTPVDLEKTTATLRDGVLTITMTKHPEAQPKQIAVTAS